MKNKILQLLFFPLLFLFAGFGAVAQTTVPALITSNQVWDVSGSPYIINQTTLIDVGVSVIVMPGTEIKCTNSSSPRLMVDGELQALGKWDSIIKITKVGIDFSTKSMDYNASTGRGAYFNYCSILGNGNSYRALGATSTDLKVENSEFNDAYYCIYIPNSSVDTNKIIILNNKFSGDKIYGSGDIIYSIGTHTRLYITGNYFTRAYDNLLYGSIVFKNNTIYKLNSSSFYVFENSEISCNRFLNMSDGIKVNTSYVNTGTATFDFSNNTLDSVGSGTFYPMLKYSKNASYANKFGTSVFHNNNFFYSASQLAKVLIDAYNNTPAKSDTVDFTSNYWGSTNSTTIAGYIKDYNDDITIYGKADFRGFDSMPIIGCSYTNNCAIANFDYSIKDSIITLVDKSYSNKSYHIKWKFGDGNENDSNKKTITHGYDKAGVYNVCLYVSDTAGNLCDSMCTTIVIKSNSKCHASFYMAVDTANANNIYAVNTSTGINTNTKYYWTFGDGGGSSATNPTHTYASAGSYQLCVTIFDTLVGCYSTFCDSVEIDVNGMVMFVLNEKDILNIKKSAVFNTVSVYPNPSKGFMKLNLSLFKSDNVSVDIVNANGQLVKSENYASAVGNNEFNIDMSEFENGLYCVNIHSENFSRTIKIVLNK